MNKKQFLSAVGERISGLPQNDIDKYLDYYGEMIDDRVEDGMTEDEATAAIGNVDDIVSDILADTPLPVLIKNKARPPRSLRGWEIALLIVGAPMWIPLLFAAAVILMATYIVIWSIVITVFSVNFAFAVSGVFGLLGGVAMIFTERFVQALFLVGAGLICIGLAIFCFFLSRSAAYGSAWLGKQLIIQIKRIFVGRKSKSALNEGGVSE